MELKKPARLRRGQSGKWLRKRGMSFAAFFDFHIVDKKYP
jgi:hypothetical protein